MPPTEQVQINFQADPTLMTPTEPYNMLTADMQHAVSLPLTLRPPSRC